MNREILEREFPKKLIKKRPGRGGGQWDYVEAAQVITRLNEAFDGEWSFSIDSVERIVDEILVQGTLSAEGVSKTQFGGKGVSFKKDGSIVCLADDYKAAASDCLKKCATLYGVALHLYMDEEDKQPKTTDQPSDKPPAEIDVNKARKTIFGIASEYLIPKVKIERFCADRYAGEAKDWSMSSMKPAEWVVIQSLMRGIKSDKKIPADWVNMVSLLYPQPVINQLIDQLDILSLDAINTAWHNNWDMPEAIQSAQTVTIETDYQKDCIEALVAKTHWKNTVSDGFVEWLGKTIGNTGELNYSEAQRVINTLVTTLRKKDIKFTLPDYTLYDEDEGRL